MRSSHPGTGEARKDLPPATAGRDHLLAVVGRFRWELLLAVAIVAVFIFGAVTQRGFTLPFSIGQMIAGNLEIALIGLGVALLMMVAEIDVSVSSVMGLTVAVLGRLFSIGVPLVLGMLVVLAIAVAIGAVNGVIALRLGVPSLVVTVAALALYRGIAYIVLGTDVIGGLPEWFTAWSSTRLAGVIPADTLVYVLVLAAAVVVVHFMKSGRRMFAVGTSVEASRYAGVRVFRIKFTLFIVSAVVAAIAGILYASRLASASPNAAVGFELYAITIALLGGVSVFGGKGTLVGVFLASVLIMEVRALLSLYRLAGQVQDLAVGLLLITVALIFSFTSRKERRSAA